MIWHGGGCSCLRGTPGTGKLLTRNWEGLGFGMAWDQETIQNVECLPGHWASIGPAPLSQLGPAGEDPSGEAARFGADGDLPQGGGTRMMQWATALAPLRNPGCWLGPGRAGKAVMVARAGAGQSPVV